MNKEEEHPTDLPQSEESSGSPHLGYQGNRLKDVHLWMTTQEAAQHSGYEVQYVRRLARQGKIGAVKKGHDWWIDVEVFAAYLDRMLESEDGRAGPKAAQQENN